MSTGGGTKNPFPSTWPPLVPAGPTTWPPTPSAPMPSATPSAECVATPPAGVYGYFPAGVRVCHAPSRCTWPRPQQVYVATPPAGPYMVPTILYLRCVDARTGDLRHPTAHSHPAETHDSPLETHDSPAGDSLPPLETHDSLAGDSRLPLELTTRPAGDSCPLPHS
ncbi:ESX-1 secretion-associated protein EspI-like [Homarus americanus]|uniref:ESX-1 secretion-associated protein EspI-like n=1 Tax=Homarus americanus TaxID=6706 RepID=UPI001C44E86C|nr:ESX-1 secretion-associated protein EspI-like [Homarus americanus]